MKKLKMYVDGASRGNPGPASYGVYILDGKDQFIAEYGESIGHATNSVAEYRALIRSMEEAKKLKASDLEIFTDSELVAKQFQGLYRVKHPDMQNLMAQVRILEKEFKLVTVAHIPRSSHPGNKRADQLANIALNKIARAQ